MKGMMKAGVVAVVLAGGIAALGGCASTAPPVAQGDPYAGVDAHVVVEPSLGKFLRTGDIRETRDGLMTVVVPVRLLYNDDEGYYIQYRFTFLDSRGVPLASQTEWKMEQIYPRVEKILTGTALDAASDWRLEIKPARGGVH